MVQLAARDTTYVSTGDAGASVANSMQIGGTRLQKMEGGSRVQAEEKGKMAVETHTPAVALSRPATLSSASSRQRYSFDEEEEAAATAYV